jgi:histidyl-tRNA synthetase
MPGISGFIEWLPEQRIVELRWLDEIRRTFESFGFCSVETPAVEELDTLLAKGETDKEIYALRRLQADSDGSDSRLGLHYDLTVPLARYVADHFNDLIFPFKRYQIQHVWRGERPQEGRYREFRQCDIDVINIDQLPIHFDAEMPAIIYEILHNLGVGTFQLGISNRKILQGYISGLGIEQVVPVIRVLDKLDKIGEKGVVAQLQTELSLSEDLAVRCLAVARIRTTDATFVEQVQALGVESALLKEGLDELAFVMNSLSHLPQGAIRADLSIARGFDYYTGTVYEGRLQEFPSLGAICSGGRYDNLTGSFINRKLPGVGISIGLTRIFAKLAAEKRLQLAAKTPTHILVVLPNEERRQAVAQTAHELRQRGFNVEMYHTASKLAQQIRYASRKGIPYVWFPPFEENGVHEIKNLASGEQIATDPQTWEPK